MEKILSKMDKKMVDSQGVKNRREDRRFYILDDIETLAIFFLT